jgi:hypothetical protein
MRWYINDCSLQGQYSTVESFELELTALLAVRLRSEPLRTGLRTTHSLPERRVTGRATLREALLQSRNRDLRAAVLAWLDRTGPFMEEDRYPEAEDFFEFRGIDVTDHGPGEAARRLRAGEPAALFTFPGGSVDFAVDPLEVDHGLPEDRLGTVAIGNCWTISALEESALSAAPPARSWDELLVRARAAFPHLVVPDTVAQHTALIRESFSSTIADRAMALLGFLDSYMAGRLPDGSEGPAAQEIIRRHFTGERAAFTGESATNRIDFEKQLTFRDPEGGGHIFAPWHGKISHRFFRLHFEWPVPPLQTRLKILYLGPKITKR